MTYEEKYDRLLFSVVILSGGLCAMGLIDAVTNVFIALGTVLYVFYRKFVIRFEIPSSLNFKEKTEYLSRNPGSRFLVFVGKGADTLAMELNLWLHLSIVTLCDALLFVLLYFLNFRSMWFGKELKKVLFVRIDLPNKNSDYCEIILKDSTVLKFEERGFYPVIRDEEIWIYSEIESIPLRYSKEAVDSITVVGRDFYKRVKK